MKSDSEATRRARRNKRLGWASERRAAEIYSTQRFPANTGGKQDLQTFDGIHVQVKAGKTITIATIFEGLDAAKVAALPTKGLAAVHVEYNRQNRRRSLICFDPVEWAEWNGYAR